MSTIIVSPNSKPSPELLEVQDEFENQEWFAATLKSIGDAVIATSAEAEPRILFMNAVAEKLTGWTLDEARGRCALKTFKIVNQKTRQPERNPIERVISEGITIALANHTVLISKSGQEFVIEDSAFPILARNGTMTGVLLVFRDVTAKALAEEKAKELNSEVQRAKQGKAAIENERENFRNLFRHSLEMVCVLKGPEHIFEFVNDAHIKVLGFDATGKAVRDVQPESVEVHGILDEVYRTGTTAMFQEIPVTVGGHLRYFNLTFAARRDESGGIDGIMILGSEITEQVLARENIKEREAKARAYIEAMPQMAFISDAEGRGVFVNHRHADYFETPYGDVKAWEKKEKEEDPRHPDDVGAAIERWQESIRTGKPFEIEYRLRRHDGEYRWHLGRALPISDGQGKITEWIGTNTDIHDQKMQADELKATQTRLNLAMQSAKISTWHIDLETNVMEASKETAAMFGLEHIQGNVFQVISSMIHEEDREHFVLTLQDCIARKADYFDEYRIVTATGETRSTRASGRIHDIGGRPFMSGIVMDITEEKRRVQQVEEAKRTAEAANVAKSAFLANMSHEIRTPLGAIIGFSELSREPDLSLEERQQYLDIVIRSGHGLTRIIDDILDLAKVEAGKLDIEEIEFSLFDFMQEVLDLFRDKAKQKGIYLILNIEEAAPQHIISDPTRLRQILINLIGNALKFTIKGGIRVNVKSTLTDRGRAELFVSVKDTGIGLSASQQQKLFEPFMQADSSTTREYGGTGLGLVLSRRLANALGGNITIGESTEGRGSTFLLSFRGALPAPAIRVESDRSAQSIPRSVPYERLSKMRVLLADDSTDNQFLIAGILKKHGAVVEVANDGEEAIRKALDSEFDLVLMDIQMPGVDGYEATRALRLNGYEKPIIALTAHAMSEERVRTRAAGCTGHLTKPINQPELIDAIELLACRTRSHGINESRLP